MAKQFTGNAKSFGHIHPLMKRTDWNEYKRNYDQDKIQYSQWAKVEVFQMQVNCNQRFLLFIINKPTG